MILIGDELICYEMIEKITHTNDISNTKPNSTLLFSFNAEIMRYCMENRLFYGVKVSSLKEAIYANALNAKYIICDSTLSSTIQKCAENYMFDAKILEIIDSNDKLEEVALKQIDGVIYKTLL